MKTMNYEIINCTECDIGFKRRKNKSSLPLKQGIRKMRTITCSHECANKRETRTANFKSRSITHKTTSTSTAQLDNNKSKTEIKE